MTDYICPNCRGGFPEPVDSLNVQDVCPWCGEPLNRQYEPPTVHSVSKVERDDDRESLGGPLYKRLFGWLE